MTNQFYSPPDELEAGTKARAQDINTISQATNLAFDKLPAELALKTGTVNYVHNTGTADNAYQVTLDSKIVSYTDGLEVKLMPMRDNTGDCTLNVNGLGNIAIKRNDGAAPTPSDLVANSPITLVYVASTNTFRMPPMANGQITLANASAAAAAASATAAATSASTANSQKLIAIAQAQAASDSATAAAGSATAAANSATLAQNSLGTKADLAGSPSQNFAVNDLTITSINGGALSGFKNPFINGDCRIDQLNNGAATNGQGIGPDMWSAIKTGTGGYTVQQIASGMPDAPFCVRVKVTSAVTPLATDIYQLTTSIEGTNLHDYMLGTSGAKPLPISFRVRASIAGTYGLFLTNGANANRWLVASYTVNAANTWENKTVTINGDTAGTWNIDNTAGLTLGFDLGSGTNMNTSSPNTWGATAARRTSGGTRLISTQNATLDITLLQMGVGPFERRSYQQELALCQWYLRVLKTNGAGFARFGNGSVQNSTVANIQIPIGGPMRATPSLTTSGSFVIGTGGSNYPVTGFSIVNSSVGFVAVDVTSSTLTPGYGGILVANSDTSATMIFNAAI